MTTEIWNEDGDHPNERLDDKFKAEGKLVGDEAAAFLAGHFSNATHNNYSARLLFDRALFGFKIAVEKL